MYKDLYPSDYDLLMLLMISPNLAAIPSADAKNANLYFLDVVQQANTIFHLFDKQFNDHLMPLIRSVEDHVGSALGLARLIQAEDFDADNT